MPELAERGLTQTLLGSTAVEDPALRDEVLRRFTTAMDGLDEDGVLTWAVPPRGQGWEDIRSFGAVGDGVTDDSAVFNAATATSARRIWVGPGTYVVRKWHITQAQTQIWCHPLARLVLPNGNTDPDSTEWNIVWVSADHCSWQGGILDGNYPGNLDQTFAERWNGIKVTGHNFTGRDIRGIRTSRHVVLLEGGSGTPLTGASLFNVAGEDCLRDVVSFSRTQDCHVVRLRASDTRHGFEFSDGVVACSVRDLYAEDCHAAFQSIIHNDGVDACADCLVDGVHCVDCERLYYHQAGEDLANTGLTLRNLSGTGWTDDENALLLLTGWTDALIDGLIMRDHPTVNVPWLQIGSGASRVTLQNLHLLETDPGRSQITLKDADDITFIGGHLKTGNSKQPIRIDITDGASHARVTVLGTRFTHAGNEDTFNIVESSGTISDVHVVGCSGIGTGNLTDHAGVRYHANTGGIRESQTVFTDKLFRLTNSDRVRQEWVDVHAVVIADNTATTVFSFTVPAQASFSTGVTGSFEGTFVFHTSLSSGHKHCSAVKLTFTVVRISGLDTILGTPAFVGNVTTSEEGSDASHTALDVSQFALAITAGAAGADQTIALRFTNDFDAGVTFAAAAVTGVLHGLTSNAASTPPYRVAA